MTYFMSILMGIIQGVAEFLPISSSGHLALFQTFFGMENMEEKYMFFTVLLHFGTLISVCMVYWRDIVDMIREFFLGIAALAGRKDTGVAPPPARRMVMLIIIATVPLFVMVFLQDAVNQLFSNSIMVSCALLATGFILFFKCFAHIIARFPIRTQSFPVVHRVSFCRSHCTPTHGSDPLILFPLPVPGSC